MEFEKDAALYQLYQFHYNVFNPKDVPMNLKKLSHAIRLSEKRTKDVCELLEKEDHIKKILLPHAVFYRITAKGVKFIEKFLDESNASVSGSVSCSGANK
jgi:predicted transcriptional regulator